MNEEMNPYLTANEMLRRLDPVIKELEHNAIDRDPERKPLSGSAVGDNKGTYITYTCGFKKSWWNECKDFSSGLNIPQIQLIIKSMLVFMAILEGKLRLEGIESPDFIDEMKKDMKSDKTEVNLDGLKDEMMKIDEMMSDIKKLDSKFDFMTTLLGGRMFPPQNS